MRLLVAILSFLYWNLVIYASNENFGLDDWSEKESGKFLKSLAVPNLTVKVKLYPSHISLYKFLIFDECTKLVDARKRH